LGMSAVHSTTVPASQAITFSRFDTKEDKSFM